MDLKEGRESYVPSPEEIRRVAAEIRAEWSEAEERRRSGIRHAEFSPFVMTEVTCHCRVDGCR